MADKTLPLFLDGSKEPVVELDIAEVARIFNQTEFAEPGDLSLDSRIHAFYSVMYRGSKLRYRVGDFGVLRKACLEERIKQQEKAA